MVENPQIGKKYWYIDDKYRVIKVTVGQVIDGRECHGIDVQVYDFCNRPLDPEVLFLDGYEGHMDAFDEAIRRVNGERKSLLQQADKLKWRLHYLTKERNAVIQK